jgi:hypothetical protein
MQEREKNYFEILIFQSCGAETPVWPERILKFKSEKSERLSFLTDGG